MPANNKNNKKAVRRGRINLSFNLDDPMENLVYEFLDKKAKQRSATGYIITLVLGVLSKEAQMSHKGISVPVNTFVPADMGMTNFAEQVVPAQPLVVQKSDVVMQESNKKQPADEQPTVKPQASGNAIPVESAQEESNDVPSAEDTAMMEDASMLAISIFGS